MKDFIGKKILFKHNELTIYSAKFFRFDEKLQVEIECLAAEKEKDRIFVFPYNEYEVLRDKGSLYIGKDNVVFPYYCNNEEEVEGLAELKEK